MKTILTKMYWCESCQHIYHNRRHRKHELIECGFMETIAESGGTENEVS